ncbi:hypothetical protein [Micromonospora siamensis]|uniref:hypothetical protein n=1 Tax=Micromonospora siamensis TaxID=299152 RepID=UPI0012FD0EE2|nr:hypothetical protein [Micromonospora siamensis]
MQPDEFDEVIHLLPIDLYARATALRPYLSPDNCAECLRIAETAELALMAARCAEIDAAGHLLGAAERLAAGHPTPRTCREADPSYEDGGDVPFAPTRQPTPEIPLVDAGGGGGTALTSSVPCGRSARRRSRSRRLPLDQRARRVRRRPVDELFKVRPPGRFEDSIAR